MRTLIILATLAALLLLCLNLSAKANTPSPDPRLSEQIDSILRAYDVPGAAVSILTADSTYYYPLGLADVADNQAVSKHTLFCVGSIAKSFISAGVMAAQEEGLLDIWSPVSTDRYGELQNPYHETDPVRLVHLLEHTAAIDESHFHLFAKGNSQTPPIDALRHSSTSLQTRWRPGTLAEYTSLASIIAADIVSAKTGQPFDAYLAEKIFTPLEMAHTRYRPEQIEDETHTLAKGYEGSPPREVPFPDLPVWPAGALHTSLEEMGRFVRMLMQHGHYNGRQVLNASSVHQMETPESSLRAEAGLGTGYSKGLEVNYEHGELFYGHTGRYGGFLSAYGYSRESGIGYVILINSVSGNKAIDAIRNLLLGHMLSNSSPPSRPAQPSLPVGLEGVYQPVTAVAQLGKLSEAFIRIADLQVIRQDTNGYYVESMAGGRTSLRYYGDSTFGFNDEPAPTMVFMPEPNSEAFYWLTEETAYRRIPSWQGYLTFYGAGICLLLIIGGCLFLLFRIPYSIYRKKPILAELLLFFSLISLLGMVIAIAVFYDPEKLYSSGAVMYYIFSITFAVLAIVSLIYIIVSRLRRPLSFNSIFLFIVSIALSTSAIYLFKHDLIGLKLWAY